MTSHKIKASKAIPRTTGTKIAVILSANAWIGTLVPCASSTILTIWARKVSFPTLIALTFKTPSWLIVAPITSSPGRRVTGMLSPVAIDSSTALSPSITSASVGIFSPGRMIMTSPISTASMEISFSSPFRNTRAVLAPSSSNLRMASEARPLADDSTYRPVRWKAMIMAATPA